MGFWDIIEPVGMIVGVIVAVAAVYFIVTAIKGKVLRRYLKEVGPAKDGALLGC